MEDEIRRSLGDAGRAMMVICAHYHSEVFRDVQA
jgi:hypothetical protein